MSDMSWKDLRDLDVIAIRGLATEWRFYVTAVSEQAETLRTDVIAGHLSADNFASDTADTVREQIDLTAGRFEDDLSDYATTRVITTLNEAADALETQQLELHEVLALIEEHDFEIEGGVTEYEVNPTGHLHRAIMLHLDPPQWLCDMAGVSKPSGWYDLVDQAGVLDRLMDLYNMAYDLAKEYQDRLRAAMSRAHDADDDAAAALTGMRENPPELPPEFGATYDELLAEYKAELSEEVASEMEAIANGESGMSPEQVNQWWDDLTDAEREALIAEHPEWVGPTDGIPAEARDTANRDLLEAEIADLDAQIAQMEAELEATPSGDLEEEIDALREQRDSLVNLNERIAEPFSQDGYGGDYFLLGYSSEADGQAIVSVGNPDTADNVNVYVPGTGGNLADVNGLINRTDSMFFDASMLSPGSETASVLWLGYDAPDNVALATDPGYAEGAASSLSLFTEGLRAADEGSAANLTMTGHSYGSTTVGIAAREEGLDVDNMIFVGSPGVGVDSAADLGIDPSHVWASRNEEDVIGYATEDNEHMAVGAAAGSAVGPGGMAFGAGIGYLTADHDEMIHGTDPTADSFGGQTFTSEATRDGTGEWYEPWADTVSNHSAYWDEGNDARDNMAYIITGLEGRVSR